MRRRKARKTAETELVICAPTPTGYRKRSKPVIWMSQIAKSPLKSLETARSRYPSSPRKAHKSPQNSRLQGIVFPQKPRRQEKNPHSSEKPSGCFLSCSNERQTCPLNCVLRKSSTLPTDL